MTKKRILVVCLNPTFQRTIVLGHFCENEVNRSSEHYFDVSGKGINAARVLVQAGDEAVHLTFAGGRSRNLYLELAEADSIDIHAPDSGSEIRTCSTILSRETGTTTEIVEEAEEVGTGTCEAVWSEYEEILPSVEAVLISGTKAPGFPEGFFPEMTKLAKKQEKIVVLDIKGKDLLNSLPYGPDAVKPNLAEFLASFLPEKKIWEHAENEEYMSFVENKMREISDRFGCVVALTRGSRSSILCPGPGEKIVKVPVHAIKPLNTIGSGDACAAGIVASLAKGMLPGAALEEGHRLARLNALNIRPGRIF